MFRTAAAATAAALLAVPAVASATPGLRVQAHVDRSDASGERISLTRQGGQAGSITLRPCVTTSATAFVCRGTGTILGIGPAKVRIRWRCPVDQSCEGRAEGAFTHRGTTIALLHVKGSPEQVQTEGATFKLLVELVGE